MTTINEVGSVTVPAVTITIPARTVSITIPAVTVTLPAGALVATTPIDLSALAQDVAKILAASVVQPPVVTPPVVVPPLAGITWFYRNGVSSFAGDFTQQGTSVDWVNGVFASSGRWGLFLPYFAANFSLPNPGFKSLLLSLKPSVPAQQWTVEFTRVGDISTGIVVDVSKYGPAPIPGVWADYVIPLADLGVDKDPALYKFGLQDQTGIVPNHWGFNNVGLAS